MAEIAVEQIVEPVDLYEDRYLGRTKAQKAKETEIRDSEREHIVSVLTRMSDGRQNRGTPKEERAAYRKVAAMIQQHRDI